MPTGYNYRRIGIGNERQKKRAEEEETKRERSAAYEKHKLSITDAHALNRVLYSIRIVVYSIGVVDVQSRKIMKLKLTQTPKSMAAHGHTY